MRVLVDAYWWLSGPPSGRNVLRELVREWSQEWPEDELTLVVPHGTQREIGAGLRVAGIRAKIVLAPRWASIHALSLLASSYRSRNFDLILTQNFGAWRAKGFSTAFVHDVLFLAHPEWFTLRERAYLALLRPSLNRVDRIFTSSNTEMLRIGRAWPRLKARVRAVGLAAPNALATVERRPVGGTIAARPYILTVARFNVRKNLGPLLDAFVSSPLSESHNFVVVGPADGKKAVLSTEVRAHAGKSIHLLGPVEAGELRWLYENACLFAMASLDEGFGLPLVEAAGFGVPIAASDIPVFREIGVTSFPFDPASVESMRSALLAGCLPTPREASAATEYTWGSTVRKIRAEAESK